MKKLTHGSTFSGIGGPEVAAEMLGWENVFHCEINEFGRKVLDYHFPNADSYADITTTDFSKWRGKVTVLTGGFPCQPFSYAGKRRGAEDDRYLWPHMLRVIDQIQPSWFVGENVAGIGTMVFPSKAIKVGEHSSLFGEGNGYDISEKRERYVLAEIIRQLENIGYSVQPFIIPACAVGAPHRRDRVFIVAYAENLQRDGGVAGDGANVKTCGAEPGGRDRAENRGRTAANTASQQIHSSQFEQRQTCYEEQIKFGGRSGEGYSVDERENRWRAFPTVAPIHRGNDGIPFSLDSLTIPFGKWKSESLKAYGNAIVPQVIYEIFKSIDVIERAKL